MTRPSPDPSPNANQAKLEICKTLHLIYDMYTDLRIKTLVRPSPEP